jgi:IS5 family transposase
MQFRAKRVDQQSFLMPTLAEQLDRRQPLKKLADAIPWHVFDQEFGEYYSEEGRPAKPVRLMVGLMLLKQMFNQSDESAVAHWVQNPYWQYFCGMKEFQWELPCDPSDLVYFRRRIGEEGVSLIMGITAEMHGERARESEVVIDSTAQEKNITYPTDTKLYRKIIHHCWKMADRNEVKLRRRYGKEVRRCLMLQRWRKDPRKRKSAIRGQRRLRTIAGCLVRELERKLPAAMVESHREKFTLYRRVLNQKPHDKEKVYSLHEPQVYCMAKGKEHKKYEFGSKASVCMTKQSGVIVAAVSHEQNLYDGDTLGEVLDQAEMIVSSLLTASTVRVRDCGKVASYEKTPNWIC